MQVFEIRDPDGHTIWFGQSYHQPDSGRPPGQLEKALPHLPCSDIAASVTHYCSALGFSINYQQHDLGVMDRDQITLLLIEPSANRPAGSGSCSFYIEDADRLHAELSAKGARVQGPPVSQVWGLREFTVLDPDGNRLTFCQTFE